MWSFIYRRIYGPIMDAAFLKGMISKEAYMQNHEKWSSYQRAISYPELFPKET